MDRYHLLFQIKSLEKMIFRTFIHDDKVHFAKQKMISTPTQMQILEYILANPKKEIYQRDLEEILNLRRATVSGVLQTMEKNQLIERIVDCEDARTKKIVLNSKTKQLFTQKKKQMEQIEKIVLGEIPKEELEIFSTVLSKMKKNIEAYGMNTKKKTNSCLEGRNDQK